jgi:hypothetical protein
MQTRGAKKNPVHAMNSEIAVHQIVGFLAEFDSVRLAKMRRQHPDEPALRPGRVLGELSAPWALRLQLADEGLQAMLAHANPVADRLARRIRLSHRAEFVAQLMALIGSGGVLGAVLGDGGDRLKVAAALLGLLGSAAALAVKFMRRDLGGADNGLLAQHTNLVKAAGQAVALQARLLPHTRSGDDFGDPAALAQAVDEANTLAGQLFVLLKQIGVPVRPAGSDLRAT